MAEPKEFRGWAAYLDGFLLPDTIAGLRSLTIIHLEKKHRCKWRDIKQGGRTKVHPVVVRFRKEGE